MKKDTFIVSDIDETLVNSVEKHVTVLNKHYAGLGFEVPNYDQVCSVGSTHLAYKHLPEYKILNEQMRNDSEFNSGLALIDGALEGLTALESILFFYLTTRPETMQKTTEQELADLGFPNREVVTRPKNIPLKYTSEWKIDVLDQASQQAQAIMVMIDDSLSLHHQILRIKNEYVRSILFDGPVTPPHANKKNWNEIVKIFEKSFLGARDGIRTRDLLLGKETF
jgi:hypothetical protein